MRIGLILMCIFGIVGAILLGTAAIITKVGKGKKERCTVERIAKIIDEVKVKSSTNNLYSDAGGMYVRHGGGWNRKNYCA